jgi:hypothetical protein
MVFLEAKSMNHKKMFEQEGAASINRDIANQATYNNVMRNSSNGVGGAIGRHLGIPSAYGNMAMQSQQMELSNFMNSPKAISQKPSNMPSFNNLGNGRLSDAFFGSQLGQTAPDQPAAFFGSSKATIAGVSLLVSGLIAYSAWALYIR